MKIEVRVLFLMSAVMLATLGISQYITFTTARDTLFSAVALTVLLLFATHFFSRTVTKPLHALTHGAKQIAEHYSKQPNQQSANLTPAQDWVTFMAHHRGEISELSWALQRIETALKQSIERLEQTLAAKEYMESELAIGRQIQMNMLTLTFPSFPKRKNLDLYATLKPAHEVSGDFYDFYFYRESKSYLLEANRFCFCVGDVSGKGVPAALFMAVIKILLKSQADQHSAPATILTHVNQVISADNPSCMFVTLFFGVLNLTSGELVYTNAGHNPPYIQRQNGLLEHLNQRHGPALGVAENLAYRESRVTLNTGDILTVFTDGVTEAMDQEQNLFSEQRLVELLRSKEYNSAEEVVHSTTEAVNQFQGEAEQADDLTMLCLKFLGEPTSSAEERSGLFKKEILSVLRER